MQALFTVQSQFDGGKVARRDVQSTSDAVVEVTMARVAAQGAICVVRALQGGGRQRSATNGRSNKISRSSGRASQLEQSSLIAPPCFQNAA